MIMLNDSNIIIIYLRIYSTNYGTLFLKCMPTVKKINLFRYIIFNIILLFINEVNNSTTKLRKIVL